MEHFDVIVVGAGISGIDAGYHLQTKCPDHSYAILEGRSEIGGTWDVFRFPGVRSDSEMYTLGYKFRPWTNDKSIAPGDSILEYVRETARVFGIDRQIRFRHRVIGMNWSSDFASWIVDVESGDAGEMIQLSCNFVQMCTGFFNLETPHKPEFPGRDQFTGPVAHPQEWPEDLDYAGKRVVVIGSGATAVTMIPALAETAEHVVMLQRSPGYIIALPDEDGVWHALKKVLPSRWAYLLTRWKNLLFAALVFGVSRSFPEKIKALIKRNVADAVGPDIDVETHFTPRYEPWDQRMCVVPDGDFFTAIREKRASVVTDRIESFTSKGIRLESGDELEADIIVTATGFTMQVMSDIPATVDGQRVDLSKCIFYKGVMISELPNLSVATGYIANSYTLKSDLTSQYVCRLLNFMARKGYEKAIPKRIVDPDMKQERLSPLSSGYVMRSYEKYPRVGSKMPWKSQQSYFRDLMMFGRGGFEDGVLTFSKAGGSKAAGSGATGASGAAGRRESLPESESVRATG